MKPSLRAAMVEEIAASLLESLGYQLVDRRRRLVVDGVEVAEVDMVAKLGEDEYAVEVKAGRASVTDIRQVYSNAKLMGAKPLLVCRGFSDKAAEKTAEKLGVKVLLLPDVYLFASPEDIEAAVEAAVEKLLCRLLAVSPSVLDSEGWRVVDALAASGSFGEAAERLGVTPEELGRMVARLRELGALSGGSFHQLRLQALVLKILAAVCR